MPSSYPAGRGRHRRRPIRPFALVPLLLMLGGAAACGHKEPPEPPPSRIPETTRDLSVHQRGQELVLKLSYPAVTVGGVVLPEIEKVEFLEWEREVPPLFDLDGEEGEEGEAEETEEDEESADEEGEEASEEGAEETDEPAPVTLRFTLPTAETAQAAQPTKEDLIVIDPREFRREATVRASLEGEDLAAAVSGDRLLIRVPLDEIPEDETVAFVFGTQTHANRKVSAISNLAKIVPRTPPEAPRELAVEAQARGVELTWEEDEETRGFHVYRRDAQVKGYGDPLVRLLPTATTYFDTGAIYGQRYIYTVTTISQDRPLLESAVAAEFEIDYRDRFAPEPPDNVVALPEEGRVRLLWEPSPDGDLEGYWIYRREEGGELETIHDEPLTGLEYLDNDVVSGATYFYAVRSADRKDNRSEPSEEIEVRVP